MSSVKTPGSLSMRHQLPAVSAIVIGWTDAFDYLEQLAEGKMQDASSNDFVGNF